MSDSLVLEKLSCSEKLLKEVDRSYEDKIRRTAELEESRSLFLQQIGLASDSHPTNSNNSNCRQPIIVNLHEDEQMSERLVYCFQTGVTVVGSSQGSNIQLHGEPNCSFN